MIHEIINPSDAYTIECENMELLTAAIFILGEGAYGTSSLETNYQVPMTIFGSENGVDFFKKTFDLDLHEYVKNHKKEIASCLSTICLGKIEDRNIYFSNLEKLDGIEKEKYIEKWYDEKQSSMNQIGQRALKLAKLLEK